VSCQCLSIVAAVFLTVAPVNAALKCPPTEPTCGDCGQNPFSDCCKQWIDFAMNKAECGFKSVANTLQSYTPIDDFTALKKVVSTVETDVSTVQDDLGHFVFDYLPDELEKNLAPNGAERLNQGLKTLTFTLGAEKKEFNDFIGDVPSLCPSFQMDLLDVLHGVEEAIESTAYIGESLGHIGLALAEIDSDLNSAPLMTNTVWRGRSAGQRSSRSFVSGSFSQATTNLCPDVTPPPPLVHLDPSYFLRRLGMDTGSVNEQEVCIILFPPHEVLRALGERQFAEGKCDITAPQDQAKCVIDPFKTVVNNLSAAMAQAKNSLYALECQLDQEVQAGKNRLCAAIANLANQTALNPNGTVKAGWEHWQGYANILKGGGGIAQQIGTMLQGIGDVSINGVSLGASVAIEGDIRGGIDYANAIGKNLARIGGDAVWLGEEIDKMTSFCRGNLNLKLMICMLQQNKAQDYEHCYAGVLDPTSVDQDFGF